MNHRGRRGHRGRMIIFFSASSVSSVILNRGGLVGRIIDPRENLRTKEAASMEFYSGIDLSARDSSICVIDGQQEKVREVKLRNDLGKIIEELTPYRPNLQIVVESTFNWYWLVDGLREAGFDVCLAHTLGLHMITGAKIK